MSAQAKRPASLLEVTQALVSMLEDSMKGLKHPTHGPFIRGKSDVQITADGSLMLSDARAAIARATGGAA